MIFTRQSRTENVCVRLFVLDCLVNIISVGIENVCVRLFVLDCLVNIISVVIENVCVRLFVLDFPHSLLLQI
jgi:hypothetical protein